jgi:hypothetical protein
MVHVCCPYSHGLLRKDSDLPDPRRKTWPQEVGDFDYLCLIRFPTSGRLTLEFAGECRMRG